jgi:hypothetical protein
VVRLAAAPPAAAPQAVAADPAVAAARIERNRRRVVDVMPAVLIETPGWWG